MTDTFELVAFLKSADESGQPTSEVDLAELQSIVSDSRPGEFAGRLIRTVLDRRDFAVN